MTRRLKFIRIEFYIFNLQSKTTKYFLICYILFVNINHLKVVLEKQLREHTQ